MKKLFVALSFLLVALAVSAVPAKRGVWQTLHLADGTEVKAQLVGDEHLHFWQSAEGQRYVVGEDGTAVLAPMEQMRQRAAARRCIKAAKAHCQRLQSPRRVNMGERTSYTGQKKGVVILMEFTNTKFKEANNLAKYKDILNKEKYATGSFKGSVADYFKAQSGGKFELFFDVVGPYTAKKTSSYYGSNDSGGNDKYPDELIVEAVKAAADDVDFRDYDWDDDGEVDQVFVVYAGKGEADGGGDTTIWPHMYWLSYTNKSLTLDGVKIDTYACSNEVTPGGSISGIGAFCHEFSHCLGYPDFYDTSYNGWFGMSQFDLMDQGSYNGNGFRPAGYTAYEKWMAGWLEPTVLADEDVTVTDLKAMSEQGGAYVMYNDAHQDEYYMIENRQKTNWDSSIPGTGLMITHVDFDKVIWEDNTPNTKVTTQDMYQYQYHKTNDHQRCTIFHADNEDDSRYWSSFAGYYTQTTLNTDLYPYNKRDSLTATSTPAATLYNKNKQGTKVMPGALLNIKKKSDGTMSFFYRAKAVKEPSDSTEIVPSDTTVVKPDTVIVAKGDTLFYESFTLCDGTGGNDGQWSTTIAGSSQKFATDNDGWEYVAAYAGYECARFGNGSVVGVAITPAFVIDGEAVLTFRAAGWNKDGTNLSLALAMCSDPDATITPVQVTMENFAWTQYTAVIKGTGTTSLQFTPVKRFLLDDVLVVRKGGDTPVEKGDVDGDGAIDVADIAAIITAMATANPDASQPGSADVNGDGIIDVADIATVLTLMAQ